MESKNVKIIDEHNIDRDANIIWVHISDDDKNNMLDLIIRKNEDLPDFYLPTPQGRMIICYIED